MSGTRESDPDLLAAQEFCVKALDLFDKGNPRAAGRNVAKGLARLLEYLRRHPR